MCILVASTTPQTVYSRHKELTFFAILQTFQTHSHTLLQATQASNQGMIFINIYFSLLATIRNVFQENNFTSEILIYAF